MLTKYPRAKGDAATLQGCRPAALFVQECQFVRRLDRAGSKLNKVDAVGNTSTNLISPIPHENMKTTALSSGIDASHKTSAHIKNTQSHW